ncbi:MAG: hypothetical protein CMJ83_11730 [Planctomycetes bacterium]|nr:hypothetical protein [Planctomycetota bacterium]
MRPAELILAATLVVVGTAATAAAQPTPSIEPASWAEAGLGRRLEDALGISRDSRVVPVPNSGTTPDEARKPEVVTAAPASVMDVVLFVVLTLITTGGLGGIGIWLARRRRDEAWDDDAPTDVDVAGDLERALADGDPAHVVAACYAYGVASFRQRRLVRAVGGLADGFILSQLESRAVREPFAELSLLFQPLRYGRRDATADHAERARTAATRLDGALADLDAPEDPHP